MSDFGALLQPTTAMAVVHQAPLSMGYSQARLLEWISMPSSRGSSRPRDRTYVSCSSCIASRFFTTEPLGKPTSCSYSLNKVKMCYKLLQHLKCPVSVS